MMHASAGMFDAQPLSFADIVTNDDDAHQEHTPADLHTFFVRALYDYQSDVDSALSFRRGALIEVLTQLETGWWDGLLDDERGWFPSNYVTEISDQEAEEELLARRNGPQPQLQPLPESSEPSPAASDWMDDGLDYLSPMHSTTNGGLLHAGSATAADDFWMPQVTPTGQIFYVNTRTGEQSSDLPHTHDELAQAAPEFALAPQSHLENGISSHRPDIHPRSRSNTTTTATPVSATAPPTASSVAGFGLHRATDVPEPWVKRLADDGLSYFYVNKETGQIQWSPPSPVTNIRQLRENSVHPPPPIDTIDENEWNVTDGPTWTSSASASASQIPSETPAGTAPLRPTLATDMNRLSVYSDDSEVNPLGASSPPLRTPPGNTRAFQHHLSTSSSNDSPSRTNTTSNDDSATYPTSTASTSGQDLTSAESVARMLQLRLLPAATEGVQELSAIARDAISAVVEAVGQPPSTPSPTSPSGGQQLSLMARRVAAVVTAVRNLLYVSGALSTPIQGVHLSKASLEDVIESGRTPLIELKPYQRKVTATLSKLVLSARAAESNPDWSGANGEDSSGATTTSARVDSDAAELERAVMTFVMEVERMDALSGGVGMGSAASHEKRLRGALVSSEGLNGIGLGVLGGGAAGQWKGLGFAPLDPGVTPPQWSLGPEVINELRALKALVDESLDALWRCHSALPELLMPHVRFVLANLCAFMSVAEDTDVARHLDVDGVRKDMMAAQMQLDTGLAEEYAQQVDMAKRLVRKLEVDKQAAYDDGTTIWTAAQAAQAAIVDEQDIAWAANSGVLGLFISPSGWPDSMAPEAYFSVMRSAVTSLRSSLAGTLEAFEVLVDVGRNQEEAARRGVRGSIGLRDGQSLVQQQQQQQLHRLLEMEETETGTVTEGTTQDRRTKGMSILGLGGGAFAMGMGMMDMQATLGLSMMDSDGEADEEDENDGMVDMGFALGSSKKAKRPPAAVSHQPQASSSKRPWDQHHANPLLNAMRNGSPMPSVRENEADPRPSTSTSMMSMTTAVPTEEDGASSIADSRTSTVRPDRDRDHEDYEDDDDDVFDDDDLKTLGLSRRKPSTAKSPTRVAKLQKIFGDDAPAHYLATQTAQAQPWFLQTETSPQDILINPDGGVRGGTLPALVERLTLHNYRDAVFNDTFLITFKSFTTIDELFDLLIQRFNIPVPEELNEKERALWVDKKQTPMRFRVINILRSMLMESHILDKEDMHILDRIKAFAESITNIVPPAKQLLLLVDRAQNGDMGRQVTVTSQNPPPPPIMPRPNRPLKLLELDPLELARQMTIMESRLFFKIRPTECLQRAKEGSADDNIKAVIDTSNKIASWVAQSILSKEDPRRRAALIKQFIMTAERCRALCNFSSMAALIAGLNSPPIRRLKRTWENVNARMIAQLDEVEKTLDSAKNFTGYRQLLSTLSPPCVPFLGVYLTTLTFINDGAKDRLEKERGNLINFNKRHKAAEVIREIKKYQSKPYNLSEIPHVIVWIEQSLAVLNNDPEVFWNQSMKLEPREREDEKMARLLQESGFL